jgi:septal ring factor EnvC (AmiA/AmiB activator)
MSTEGTVVGAAPGQPDGTQALQEEIERTRVHLGETVEALMAKVDVKARAQDEASRLIGRLKARAVQARTQAAARAAQARQQAAAAAGISKVMPEPVKTAVANAADTARRRRTPLAAAIGAVAAGLLGWLLIKRWRQRG